jgi:hypothetical protein
VRYVPADTVLNINSIMLILVSKFLVSDNIETKRVRVEYMYEK